MFKYIYISFLAYTIISYFIIQSFDSSTLKLYSIQMSIITICSMISFLDRYRKERIICFDLFFFIFFFICTYVYPLFLYDQIPSRMFNDVTYETSIKSLAVATSAILSYIIGGTLVSKKEYIGRKSFNTSHYNPNKINKVLNIFTFIIFIIFIFNGGLSILYKYSDGIDVENQSIAYFFFVKIFLLMSTIFEFIRLNNLSVKSTSQFIKQISKFYLLNFCLITFFLLVASDRGELILQVLSFILLFSLFVKPIKKRYLFIGLFIGLLMMVTIKNTRHDRSSINQTQFFNLELANMVEDFMPASASLNILIKLTDQNGCTMGEQYIPHVLSIIPFSQSMVSSIFKIDFQTDMKYKSSGYITTIYTWGNTKSGMGTHVVGDIYYSFGWIGAMVILFLWGVIISLLDKKVYYTNWIHIKYLLPFIYFFGCSIYFSRVEIVYQIRTICFSFIIIFLISIFFPYKNKLTKTIEKKR